MEKPMNDEVKNEHTTEILRNNLWNTQGVNSDISSILRQPFLAKLKIQGVFVVK